MTGKDQAALRKHFTDPAWVARVPHSWFLCSQNLKIKKFLVRSWRPIGQVDKGLRARMGRGVMEARRTCVRNRNRPARPLGRPFIFFDWSWLAGKSIPRFPEFYPHAFEICGRCPRFCRDCKGKRTEREREIRKNTDNSTPFSAHLRGS